jgi:putative tryptophan/tyrosine transport system substrate-binding protein
MGILANPNDPNYETDIKGSQMAADALGHKLVIANIRTESEIESAFAALVQQQISALFVNADPLYNVNSQKILGLAAQHAMLTVSSWEGFAAEGGLISYGTSINEANRQLGIYSGKVLKGTRPGDLPVMQSTKFQLVINLKTARALNVDVPTTLIARADEVIE